MWYPEPKDKERLIDEISQALGWEPSRFRGIQSGLNESFVENNPSSL